MPSPFGAGPAHEKKIGHRRVDASGETTYKKVGFPLYLSLCFFLNIVYWFARNRDFISSFPPTPNSVVLFHCSPPPDHLLCLERGHPTGHWIYRWQPQLQAGERCADAGLLCGRKHLLPKVWLCEWMPFYVNIRISKYLIKYFIFFHSSRCSPT